MEGRRGRGTPLGTDQEQAALIEDLMGRHAARKVWTAVGVTAAIAALGAISYGVASAASRPRQLPPPRYPHSTPEPGEPVVPLRPDPLDDPVSPGPLAQRLQALIGDLSDDELRAVRFSMPSHWWEYILSASEMPTDNLFALSLHPMSIDLGLWPDDQVDQLKDDLVASMGYLNAYELQSILEDGGVL